jgi:hypothetical protein
VNEHNSENKNQKYFEPDEELIGYIRKKLNLLQKRQQIIDANIGGELTSEEESMDKSLRTQKNKILNKLIFPSMANLTYFLECIAKHPELQVVFENDLKELFGLAHSETKGENGGVMFDRLISAALIWNPEAKDAEKKDTRNFRLTLLRIIQNNVYYRIQHLLLDDFTNDTASIINSDIGRARAWVDLFASRVDNSKDNHKALHRTFDFKAI